MCYFNIISYVCKLSAPGFEQEHLRPNQMKCKRSNHVLCNSQSGGRLKPWWVRHRSQWRECLRQGRRTQYHPSACHSPRRWQRSDKICLVIVDKLEMKNMEMKLKIPLKQPEFVIVRQVHQPYKTSWFWSGRSENEVLEHPGEVICHKVWFCCLNALCLILIFDPGWSADEVYVLRTARLAKGQRCAFPQNLLTLHFSLCLEPSRLCYDRDLLSNDLIEMNYQYLEGRTAS